MVGRWLQRRKLWWVLWPLVVVGAVFGARYIAIAVVQLAHFVTPLFTGNTIVGEQWFRVVALIAAVGMAMGVSLIVAGQKLSRKLIGIHRLPNWQDIGLGVAGFVIYAAVATILLAVLKSLSLVDIDQLQTIGSTGVYGMDRMMVFVALTIVVPFVEELLFRGYLYGRLRGAHAPLWLSASITSLTFGVLHGQWNVGIDVFCLSMVACYLREQTGTVWPGVIMHMIKNMIAFYIAFSVT